MTILYLYILTIFFLFLCQFDKYLYFCTNKTLNRIYMKFIAVIPARYASTRFPGKPLARSIEVLFQVLDLEQRILVGHYGSSPAAVCSAHPQYFQQRTCRPSAINMGGRSVRHRSSASLQRVQNLQPLGIVCSVGTVPSMV